MPMVLARFGQYLYRARNLALPVPAEINRRPVLHCKRVCFH
jgi:hypothetical protein